MHFPRYLLFTNVKMKVKFHLGPRWSVDSFLLHEGDNGKQSLG